EGDGILSMPAPALPRLPGEEAVPVRLPARKEEDPIVRHAEAGQPPRDGGERGAAQPGSFIDDQKMRAGRPAQRRLQRRREGKGPLEGMSAGADRVRGDLAAEPFQRGRDDGGEARPDAPDADTDCPARPDLAEKSNRRFEIALRIEGVVSISLREPDRHAPGE